MSRYDGLIIPRSYSEYINKTDATTLQQALQLSGVLSGAVAAGDNKAVTSSAVNGALAEYGNKVDFQKSSVIAFNGTNPNSDINYEIGSVIPFINNLGSDMPASYWYEGIYGKCNGQNIGGLQNQKGVIKAGSIFYAQLLNRGTFYYFDVVTDKLVNQIATKSDLGIKNITIEDTAHNFGGVGTDELYAEFDLSSYKVSPCAYIGFLRCGGAQSKAYLFTFGLVVSYGNWAFSEISKSWQGANLTFDITTSKLRMTLTDNTIGLYEDSLTLLKIQ